MMMRRKGTSSVWFGFIAATACVAFSCTCATTKHPDALAIRSNKIYKSLNENDTDIVDDIISKALKSKRTGYYFKKLKVLLETKTNHPRVTEKMNKREIERSVVATKIERRKIAKESKRDLEEYMEQEEFYENMIERHWRGYTPKWGGPYFYVVDEDPLDILVHIQVKLVGSPEMIEKILILEDAIEKHLYVEGFSVNLVFIARSGDDVFNVQADPSKWATSYNWSGGHKALAHELMHLMGLPDEYDRLEIHHDNKNMSVTQRLLQFRVQMDKDLPPDATKGIMCYHGRKPLERHVCTSVGLGEDCVEARIKAFHSDD